MFLGENTIKHRFSGNRCSDQFVFLNAYSQWENYNLSDNYNLSTSVLKTSCNIKVGSIPKSKGRN